MRFAQSHGSILFVQAADSLFSDHILIGKEIFDLTTAANTSTWTRHDFNKMVFALAFTDFFNQLCSIGCAIDNCDFDIQIANR